MRCRFKHKIFQNEENGYTIAIFTTQDTSVPLSARDKYLASRNIIGFSAIGFGLPLTDEIELEMEGRWESGEHGTQYQVENFMEVVPRTKEGILGYLSSGAIKGIGPKMADTIFRKFGLQTLEIMENNPQELLKIRGISEKKLAAIVESYGKNQVFRELMTFLAPFKVTPKKVNMILKKFGNESVDIIRHRPYMLSAVKGFGFLTVDAIGRQCCCALNDPMRISGCIGHIMNQAMKEGHLFKQRQEVIREALEMLNRDLQVMAVSEQDVSQVLYRLVLQKSIVVEEERIYSIRQYEEETQTASMIARRLLEKPVLLSIEPELEKAQKTLGITLSETQKQAVRMVFAHPISIITGGPGTGKTTIINVIIKYFSKKGMEIKLCAPTGRAAKRMTESTGWPAQTIHRLLEISGAMDEDSKNQDDHGMHFSRNADNPLECDAIIVDEMSMVDAYIFYSLVQAVPYGTRLIFVGDVNQLPSVGAGNVLKDIINSGCFPVTTLNKIFRQEDGSDIVFNAHKIQRGEHLILTNKSKDFFFIPQRTASQIIEEVQTLTMKNLPNYYGFSPQEIQILCPMRKYEVGVENMNQKLQNRLNPKAKDKPEHVRGDVTFRKGDKVMQIKNNYQQEWKIYGVSKTGTGRGYVLDEGVGVFNGDMGVITDISDYDEELTILFDDGRESVYNYKELDQIEHAFAVTIHKSQGSEYPAVIIPLLGGNRKLMNRNLIYTAITRARQLVIIVGDVNLVNQMVDNSEEQKRYTSLALRLEELNESME